jgi:hypothetical protein
MSEERATYQVSASAGGPMRMARLVDGDPVWQEVSPEEMAAYVPPPSDKYHVRITGFGEPYQRPKRAEWIKEGGPTHDTMTRLEFEIQNGKGKGRKFSASVNCVVGPKSNLGQVWLAAVGPIPPTIEMMDLLGKELNIYVEQNEGIDANGNKKKYANPTWSTAKPVGESAESDDEWPAA